MSPELFDPEGFDLKDGRQTKPSDCYAFGMVMYEVLAGRAPFHRYHGYAVVVRILKGERPGKPQGEEGGLFADDIWSVLDGCWQPNPGNRPSIRRVLQCLERVSSSWTPRTVVGLPSNLPSRTSEQSAEESADECEGSSPPRTVSSQSSRRHPLKGDPSESSICPPTHEFSALPCDAPGYRGLGMSVVNPHRSDSEEPAGIPDGVSWVDVLDGSRH